MTFGKYIVAAFIGTSLTACGNSAPSPDVSNEGVTLNVESTSGQMTDAMINSDSGTKDMAEPTQAHESGGYKPITLIAFECGDNCYLHYFPRVEGSRDEFALCQADICEDWKTVGLLPTPLEKAQVKAKFGTGNQVDGSGNVMIHNYPAITDIKLSEPDKDVTE